MTELYDRRTLEDRRRRIRRRRIAAGATALITLAACVIFCAVTDTANAAAMERAAVTASSLGGAAVILMHVFLIRDEKVLADHEQRILGEEKEQIAGTVHVGDAPRSIPRSICVVPVRVEAGEKQEYLQIEASRAQALRDAAAGGNRLRLEKAQSYVSGYEVSANG